MKKVYVQPEFDLLKLSSSEDILVNSIDDADVTDMAGGDVANSGNQDYNTDDDIWA